MNGCKDQLEDKSKNPKKTQLILKAIMTTTFGMTSTLPTEINKLKKLLLFINVNLIQIQATLRQISLKRKDQLISVYILLEDAAQKESIADFIIEYLRKKTQKRLTKII